MLPQSAGDCPSGCLNDVLFVPRDLAIRLHFGRHSKALIYSVAVPFDFVHEVGRAH